MKNRLNLKVISILFLLVVSYSVYAQTQNLPNPRQEKLLNGLKVLMLNDPQAEKVSVKIRVHSGSAFDPQGKEGVMQMLADNIFPDGSAKEFFADDLGGSLDVVTNYDYIQINATAKSEEFLTMLETLAGAVSKPTIDKETTAKLRSVRLEKLKELEKDSAYMADRAAAQKLLGTFPYGRPQAGTLESVQKIDFADLIFAKDRFFTADNATIFITGNFKPELAFRAARRYFGAWAKSENRVPATFRQPDEPDTKAAVIKSSVTDNSEIRYALRGFARSDKDFTASKVLTKIMQNRLRKNFSKEPQINAFVRQDSNLLPGVIIVGLSNLPKENGISAIKNENLSANLVSGKITVDEFEKAKTEVLAEMNQQSLADLWLDVETYRLASAKDELQKVNNVTINEVQTVAEKLIKNPTVTVMLVNAKDEKKM